MDTSPLVSVVVVGRILDAQLDRWTAQRTFLGRAGQAIFLGAIERVDPARARTLHDDEGPRPYTVGVLLTPARPEEQWQLKLRFTTLTPDLAELLPPALAQLPSTLQLDDLTVAVDAILRESAADRDAGATTYQEILNRRLLGPEPPDGRIGLRLLTPTTFHSSGRNQPLPLPGLVFGSLVDRWNAFSPLTLNAEARRYAEECLAVAQFRLESRLVEVAGGKQIGAIGSVIYRSLRPDPYWLRVIAALADFAFYAGVGAKTAIGLGQARRVDTHGGAVPGGAGSDAPEGRGALDRQQGGRDAGDRASGEG